MKNRVIGTEDGKVREGAREDGKKDDMETMLDDKRVVMLVTERAMRRMT